MRPVLIVCAEEAHGAMRDAPQPPSGRSSSSAQSVSGHWWLRAGRHGRRASRVPASVGIPSVLDEDVCARTGALRPVWFLCGLAQRARIPRPTGLLGAPEPSLRLERYARSVPEQARSRCPSSGKSRLERQYRGEESP
jgi:hypothetical protein